MSKIDNLSDAGYTPPEETTMFQKIGIYEIEPQGVHILLPRFKKDGSPLLKEDGTQLIERIRISYTPFVISSLGRNIDNGEKSVLIDYVDNRDRRSKEWISTIEALSRDVLKLVKRGVVFPEKQTKYVNEYLSYYLFNKGKELPEQDITNKNGWKNSQYMFVIGENCYTENGTTPIINNGDRAITGALKPHGKIEDWTKSIKPLIGYTNVRFKSYGALAAPLLRLLNQQSFLIHNYDESSVGKSTISNIAMSHVGDPKILENSANSTQTGAERLAEIFTDLPLNLDETSAAKTENLKVIVYMIGNERGRSRGNRDSMLREISTWKTVCLTTGEAPITNDATFTGAKIRVIEIYGGIGAHVPKEIETAKGIYSSYGHIFPIFIKKVFENKKEIQNKYIEYREIFQEEIKSISGMDTRLIDTFAVITTSGYLLEQIYKELGIEPKDPIEITKQILKDTVNRRRTERYGSRALESIGSWIESKTKYFIIERGKVNEKKEIDLDGITDDDKVHEIFGWISHIQDCEGKIETFIDILPHQLKKFLTESGYNPDRCLEDWREQKIIICSDGRFSTTQRHSFDMKRVIRFKSESVTNLKSGGI